VSSLGEAAVLMSALAHGPRAALDSVFAKSRCGVTAARDPVARRA
jgi:hypothetical protein